MNIFTEIGSNKPIIFVFSHPNHEIAALGTIRRLRPQKIIYITDGGGQHRVEETKTALSQIDLLDRAIFLDCTEQSVYEAILSVDREYFVEIGTSIKRAINGAVTGTVFCDAVEFYNPVHDITHPLVKSLGSFIAVVEVPLAYENRRGEILLQKPPDLSSPQAMSVLLTCEEEELKKRLLKTVYRSLGKDIESLISADASVTQMEWFIKGRSWPILPTYNQVIRYNARGARLVSDKVFSRAITFKEHYGPLVAKLFQ